MSLNGASVFSLKDNDHYHWWICSQGERATPGARTLLPPTS